MTDLANSQDQAMRDATRAVAYARCSTRTNSDGDSFQRQERAVQTFAKRAGIEVVATYRDVVSGTAELENRTGLSALMEHVRGNGVGVVIVENASRLARDALVHHLLIRKLADMGVRVLGADGTDLGASDDPMAKFVGTVLSALAALDREMTVSRLRAARERIRETKGRCEGRRPYGATENEQAAIKRARALRRKRGGRRRSYAQVAAILDAEGHRPRGGGKWSPASLAKILSR